MKSARIKLMAGDPKAVCCSRSTKPQTLDQRHCWEPGKRVRFERIGAVGLGTASIAGCGSEGTGWTFFEIDAAIVQTRAVPL
jgi:hypothetical protein